MSPLPYWSTLKNEKFWLVLKSVHHTAIVVTVIISHKIYCIRTQGDSCVTKLTHCSIVNNSHNKTLHRVFKMKYLHVRDK